MIVGNNIDASDDQNDRRRGAVAAYRWWDRIGWLRWLFDRGGEMAGRLFAAGVIATAGGWTAVDMIDARARGKFLLPTISAERLSPATHAYVIQGVDQNGRRADFDLIVADKEFTWERGSTERLMRADAAMTKADIERVIFDPLVRARLEGAKQLIAVGTASEEGDASKETYRAGKRAEQTASWLASVTSKDVPLYTLNLGQYKQPCEACNTAQTDWQRPFLVVAVQRYAFGADIGEALADALSATSNLPAPERYSAYALARFR